MRKEEKNPVFLQHRSSSTIIHKQTCTRFSLRIQKQILMLFLLGGGVCFSSSCAPSSFMKLEETCKLGKKKDCDALYKIFRDEIGAPERGIRAANAQPRQSPDEIKRKHTICVSMQALCESNQIWGCFATGLCYLKHHLKAKDPKQRAASMFSRACKGQIGVGCMFAAETLRQQIEPHLSKQEKEQPAFRWEKAHPPKGALQVEFSGEKSPRRLQKIKTSPPNKPSPRLPEQDPKVPLLAAQRIRFRKQWSQINGYYQQGCANKFLPACTAMGLSYELGRGLPVLVEKANATYRLACRRKERWACVLLGRMYQQKSDHSNAQFYYRLACGLRDGRGCASLGKYFAESHEHSKAAVLYSRACRLRSGFGCYSLARLLYFTEGPMRARRHAYLLGRQGCVFGNLDACAWYADDLEKGKYNRKDPKKAWELAKAGCSREHRWSCVLQARFYLRGVGTPIYAEKGNRIFQSLCRKKYYLACHEHAINYLPSSWEENLVSLISVSDIQIAVDLLRKNCKKKYRKSCYHLVWPSHWLMRKAGKDAKESCVITNRRYRSLCAQDYKPACYWICKKGWIRKSKKKIQIRFL